MSPGSAREEGLQLNNWSSSNYPYSGPNYPNLSAITAYGGGGGEGRDGGGGVPTATSPPRSERGHRRNSRPLVIQRPHVEEEKNLLSSAAAPW